MTEPEASVVSIIDFQMTVANLSVAEHALREEPYARLPYLAGSLAVAQHQMEQLRQESMRLRGAIQDIVKHQEISAGSMAKVPTTWNIAKAALEKGCVPYG